MMPRKSPFRNSSNVNFLLHNEDNEIKLVAPSKKVKLFEQNHVVVVNNAGNFQKELEREREENRIRLLEKMNQKKTEETSKIKDILVDQQNEEE